MKEKLKRCPFCGGEARVSDSTEIEAIIECKNCQACIFQGGTAAKESITKHILNDAVERWNKREG